MEVFNGGGGGTRVVLGRNRSVGCGSTVGHDGEGIGAGMNI
jgi:hypothetical protein